MKSLKGIAEKLKSPNSRTEDKDIPIYLDIVIDSLTHSKGDDATDSIRLFKLAEKLVDLKDPFQVENYDFEKIKKSCSQNPVGYLSWAHGQMMLKIQDWEREEGV